MISHGFLDSVEITAQKTRFGGEVESSVSSSVMSRDGKKLSSVGEANSESQDKGHNQIDPGCR